MSPDPFQHRSPFANHNTLLGIAFDEQSRIDVGTMLPPFFEGIDADGDCMRDFITEILEGRSPDEISGDIALIGECDLAFLVQARGFREE